jgi:hypothetical protein
MVLTTRLKLLSAAAAAVLVYVLATGPDTPTSSVDAVQPQGERTGRAPAAAASRNVTSNGSSDVGGLLARLAHRVTDGKAASALFNTQSWHLAPPPPPPPAAVVVPPPPPTAPPLPFSVMGSYARPGDATTYFLTRGERVFDVRVGDTIDNTYSVDSASESQLLLTYKPLNIQQALILGGSQ